MSCSSGSNKSGRNCSELSECNLPVGPSESLAILAEEIAGGAIKQGRRKRPLDGGLASRMKKRGRGEDYNTGTSSQKRTRAVTKEPVLWNSKPQASVAITVTAKTCRSMMNEFMAVI